MARKPGKAFEDRIRKRLVEAGCHVLKIPDVSAPFIRGTGAGQDAARGARFAPKNPYDFQVLYPVETKVADRWASFQAYALECKTTAGKRFDLATVKPHQLKGLREFPGVAAVVIELREVSRCFFVQIDRIELWNDLGAKKSMNLTEIKAEGVELLRNTRKREKLDYYDVTVLLPGAVRATSDGKQTTLRDYFTEQE